MFQKDVDSVRDKTTAAEVYFVSFIAEHNLPFLTADHFIKLCKKMFPDSNIAQEFACRRTKTTAIVKYALAPTFNAEVVTACLLGQVSEDELQVIQQLYCTIHKNIIHVV